MRASSSGEFIPAQREARLQRFVAANQIPGAMPQASHELRLWRFTYKPSDIALSPEQHIFEDEINAKLSR